jgi:thiol-disulfide isomerase/thioredoxin
MRQISILATVLVFALISCTGTAANKKSNLSGIVEKHTNVLLYLEQIDEATVKVIDSVKTNEKGEFSFPKKIETKDFYRLRVSQNNSVFIVLSPEEHVVYNNSNMMLQEGYTLQGSVEGDLILEIKRIREGINKHRDSLMSVLNAAPMESRAAMQQEMEGSFNDFVQKSLDADRAIINKNPDKLAIVIAAELLDPDSEMEIYTSIADNMTKHYPNSGFAKSFVSRVEQMKTTAIGSLAPEINLPSPSGELIPLSSLRGKVVLIDFWASWCGPCRKENPNVVAMYNELKSKGFDIYSVSLDKDKAAWERAIAQDGLVWKSHVSDLAYWSSVVVKQYGFQGIPFTVLIDKEGKIVAKGLRGEALENAVKQLL